MMTEPLAGGAAVATPAEPATTSADTIAMTMRRTDRTPTMRAPERMGPRQARHPEDIGGRGHRKGASPVGVRPGADPDRLEVEAVPDRHRRRSRVGQLLTAFLNAAAGLNAGAL